MTGPKIPITNPQMRLAECVKIGEDDISRLLILDENNDSNLSSIITKIDLLNAILGITSGAAVVTDANGTLQQYLRGLIKLWLTTVPSGAALASKQDFAYKGGGRKTMAGAAQSVAIPSGSRYVELSAEVGDGRFNVDAAATATSQRIVEDLVVRKVWLVGNTSLSVYGETGTYVYYEFYG